MADEKKFTPQEAAIAVLKKAEEMLKSSSLLKAQKMDKALGGSGSPAVPTSRPDGGFGAIIARSEDANKENEIGTKFQKKDETMAGDKKAPSNSNKPRIEEKPTERDYNDFETKPGNAKEDDHREATQESPEKNPHEKAEGNNNDWGTDPGVKGHIKLAHFMGHSKAKKQQQGANGVSPAQGAELEKAADYSYDSGIKGVHPSGAKKGVSHAGAMERQAGLPEAKGPNMGHRGAKAAHARKLAEMKAMPKPKLTKSANPDEKQDAKLGEEVEKLTEKHMLENKAAEKKEGHKIMKNAGNGGEITVPKMKKGIALS